MQGADRVKHTQRRADGCTATSPVTMGDSEVGGLHRQKDHGDTEVVHNSLDLEDLIHF